MEIEQRMFEILMIELKHQIRFAARAYDDIGKGVKSKSVDDIWYSIQAFLIAIGNISKILWPPDKKCRKRGLVLRKHLDIPNTSPLKSREFRNHFEHYDERIQTWSETIGGGLFIDSSVTDRDNLISDVSLEQNCSLRHFITNTFTLKFRGERYELKPVADAIVELHKVVVTKEEELRNKMIEKHMKLLKSQAKI